MLYDTVTGISYHITSYHIVYHILSYHIISHIVYHVMLYHIYHIIPYHSFSFPKSIQDYIIHMDMEIVIFVGIKG